MWLDLASDTLSFVLYEYDVQNLLIRAADQKSLNNISLFAAHRRAAKYNDQIYVSRAAAEEIITQHKKHGLKPFCYVMCLCSMSGGLCKGVSNKERVS